MKAHNIQAGLIAVSLTAFIGVASGADVLTGAAETASANHVEAAASMLSASQPGQTAAVGADQVVSCKLPTRVRKLAAGRVMALPGRVQAMTVDQCTKQGGRHNTTWTVDAGVAEADADDGGQASTRD